MLAYGGSKRTLRFSHQEELCLDPFDLFERLPKDLVAAGQLGTTTPRRPVEEDFESYPPLLPPSTPSRRSRKVTPNISSRSNTSTSTAITSFPNCHQEGVQDQGDSDNRGGDGAGVRGITRMDANGGGRGDTCGQQQRPNDRAPARKRFRLDIDLGSDSDSSCDHDDDKHRGRRHGEYSGSSSTQQGRSSSGGRLRNDLTNHNYGFSNDYRKMSQGDEDSGTASRSLGSQQRRSATGGVADRREEYETPVHDNGRWQDEGTHCRE
ncbi:unnamed protein product, partial [Pylaiella littoralis]